MTARRHLEWSEGAAGPVLAALAAEQSQDWRDYAACATVDPEVWFPDKGGSTEAAKRICRECFVRADCLEYALANDEKFGVWGGLSVRQRERLTADRGAA